MYTVSRGADGQFYHPSPRSPSPRVSMGVWRFFEGCKCEMPSSRISYTFGACTSRSRVRVRFHIAWIQYVMAINRRKGGYTVESTGHGCANRISCAGHKTGGNHYWLAILLMPLICGVYHRTPISKIFIKYILANQYVPCAPVSIEP